MSESAANDDDSSAEPSHWPGPGAQPELAAISPDSNQLLREFRNQWKAELTSNARNNNNANSNSGRNPVAGGGSAATGVRQPQHKSTEEEIAEATKLFEDGSQLEDLGKVFEAMHLYRKAMQLVPNIEMHVYQNERERLASEEQQMQLQRGNDPIAEASSPSQTHEDDDDLANVDLIAHFQHRLEQSGAFIQRAQPASASGASASTSPHIGDLPAELLLYILRWVVSAQLDTRSLDNCALVSRGFYLCARDPDIWRRACQRVWGTATALASRPAFSSWRHMYRSKARIHLHGVYISRTSYFRYGENSFQDQFYRPMHLIEYYRYVRFFADGRCYMLTTPDAPATIVPRLVQQPRQLQRPDLLCGTYRLDEAGNVELQMRRNRVAGGKEAGVKEAGGGGGGGGFGRRRRASNAVVAAAYDADRHQSYRVVYRIRKEQVQPTVRPSALVWTEYEVFRDVLDGPSVLHNKFDLKPAMYPALVFSRVADFHSVAAEPLA